MILFLVYQSIIRKPGKLDFLFFGADSIISSPTAYKITDKSAIIIFTLLQVLIERRIISSSQPKILCSFSSATFVV